MVRLIVAGGIAGAASAAAMLARRGRAWRRRMFEGAGLPFAEHTYEEQARLLEDNGITRVPTVAWVPDGGGEGWAAEGVPTARALARWVGP